MQLSDRQITDALETYPGKICVFKDQIDEVSFGPNEFFSATDRKHEMVTVLEPDNSEQGWRIVEAVLFLEKEAI